ncbi:melanoma inhibitory activity protein 2 isoform X2 [Ochotona princeps]|uniref:melanoma inhibitory activity protein 2 isoform X2 n=1 Tax=Ochotona princeps TaxID=9978 RepID=UPI002714C181|nr:melanoma inhibitory activity protein 2 isoform X2 [Ochotona princeps]
MAEFGVHRILLLVVCLTKCLEGTKLLANLKKCGDLECETLLSRVLAMSDYRGPDCRYLNFTKGEEISVFVKLAGEREDLWAGSKGKDFGYFPRDAVQIEEVFISEEVEIPTKESDFLCLLGVSYTFESEDDELNDNAENIHTNEEDEEQIFYEYEKDFHLEPGFFAASESTLFENQLPVSEDPEDPGTMSGSKEWVEEAEGKSTGQDRIPEADYVPVLSAGPESNGWFGVGKEQAEDMAFASTVAPIKDSSLLGSKTTMEDEDKRELNNDDLQGAHGPEPEFDAVPKEQSEPGSQSEHMAQPLDTGWFGGGFASYLGFADKGTELEVLTEDSNASLPDVPSSTSSVEEPTVPCTEIPPVKEDPVINDSSHPKPSWFDFGFAMLGFAYASEEKIISDNAQNEEVAAGNEYEQPLASDFDPDKEQDIRMTENIKTEDQVNKRILEETDDSDTLPYFKKFLTHFESPWSLQRIPKETELQFPQQMLDQDNVVENDKIEEFLVKSYPTDKMQVMRKSKNSQPELLNGVLEEASIKTSSSSSNDETSTLSEEAGVFADMETDGSADNSLLNSQRFAAESSLLAQKYSAQKEDASEVQILEYLFQIVCDFMNSVFPSVLVLAEMVVATLPEDMRSQNPYGFPWEWVILAAIVGIFAVFLFLWRSVQSIRSRLYVVREKKLAVKLSELITEKCKLLEKISLAEKECEGLESSLKDGSFEESKEVQALKETYEKLESLKTKLEDEVLCLEKQLEEEKSKHSEQDELFADILQSLQSLEDESKSLKSQVAEAKTTFKVFQMNEERLKIAIKEASNENSQLQESQKQFSQETEIWKEKVNELKKQKVAFENFKAQVEQVLSDKENQIKSLTEHLLKMKDWAAILGEDITDDDSVELDMKSDSENGAHLDNHPKGAMKKLIHAAKLNAYLKSLEGERNQIYTQLSDADKAKEDLTEHIKNLQTEQASLQSENEQFESEIQKLQQKLTVMTELYQENEMKLHRKLTVEENSRLEKEEKLSKVDEKLNYATEELETYRKRAKDLEEELERTIHSYQGQLISYEKKAHDNWLAARTAERHLSDLKKENSYNRQKLTETEFKFELLEKDPFALDVPNTTFGREHSPYGPSPLGRPSSETRAFLSPPTLLEGPLRLSPLLPGGGGRGSRGPENSLDPPTTSERGESNYDKYSDPHREPSDTGSLSPPWEQDRRMMIPPPGQPYPDPSLPPQRQERFYSHSGRLSGPAELRSFNMPSLDKMDGTMSSEIESSRNDIKDNPGKLNVSDSSVPAESEVPRPGCFSPPQAPVRGPFLPIDPYLRRGPPFPPPPGSVYGIPRDYFPPRDFPGPPPPPPPFAMRNVYPPRGYPHYFPPRAGFLPPPAPHSENRSEFPSGIPPPNEPAERAEPRQEA